MNVKLAPEPTSHLVAMKVPFLDLKAQYAPIRDEIRCAIERVIEENAFAGGPFVAEFERNFAAYCHAEFAVAVNSGTTALWLALLASGVGAGDEVITVPNTFIATAEAISYCGAKPVFVDVDPATYTMDPAAIDGAITPRTKAIVPVHLFGQPADMDPIVEIARLNGLIVIEDACQAHGAEYKGRRAGSIGDAGCFSFYPGKNLGAMGEGGAIVTQSPEMAEKMACLRDHGQTKKYHHSLIGWNGRMDGIQGAALDVKLRYLDKWNEARRANAALYDALLPRELGVIAPKAAPYARHVYHLYAIQVDRRDELIAELKERDIHCGIHYPIPVHLQPAYDELGLGRGDFPVSERSAERLVSLPMFAELEPDQIECVAQEIRRHLSGS
jgi:dTDP-4-amino-4,6-dideoxygalactose transaminase